MLLLGCVCLAPGPCRPQAAALERRASGECPLLLPTVAAKEQCQLLSARLLHACQEKPFTFGWPPAQEGQGPQRRGGVCALRQVGEEAAPLRGMRSPRDSQDEAVTCPETSEAAGVLGLLVRVSRGSGRSGGLEAGLEQGGSLSEALCLEGRSFIGPCQRTQQTPSGPCGRRSLEEVLEDSPS